jgi:hypothetical protein
MGPLPRIAKTTSPLVRAWTAKEPECKKARASEQEQASQGGVAGNNKKSNTTVFSLSQS